ncbi:MAG: hypothetical protein KAS72_04645 [Phycisphaerales bacterium]|nr:hypothetical protein [Phycisphaerales bacterium]
MKRTRISGLVVLNVALLVVLAFVSLSPPAQAQGARRPGDYLIVGGAMKGETSNAIYVLDTANLEVIGLVFDRSGNRIPKAIWHDVKQDLERGASR